MLLRLLSFVKHLKALLLAGFQKKFCARVAKIFVSCYIENVSGVKPLGQIQKEKEKQNMANHNYKKIVEVLTELGLLDKVQTVQGKDVKQCTSVWYMGKQYRTSALCGKQIKEFFELLKQGIEPCGSVAKQKINTAHGYSEDIRNANALVQERTYADDFNGIKFVGRNPYAVLVDAIDYSTDYRNWAITMYDIHCKPYDDEEKNMARGLSKKACMDMIKDMINNKQVIVINGYITAKVRFENALDRWESENDKKLENKEEILNNFLKQTEAWA